MGPIGGRQVPGGPHIDPMNFAIWDDFTQNAGITCIYNLKKNTSSFGKCIIGSKNHIWEQLSIIYLQVDNILVASEPKGYYLNGCFEWG